MNFGGSGAGAGREDVPALEPRALFEKRVARDKARLRAYNQILGQINSRIKATAQLPGNPNYLTYTVPPFILGLPALDLKDCIVYLVHQLRVAGFLVRFTYPNLLFVSWQHYEQEYMKEHNPITQAMKPPEKPSNTSKKGAGGKRGAAPTPTVRNIGADLSRIGGAGAAPRSAADYTPPDTFLDSVQRPIERMPQNKTDSLLAELFKF